MFSNCGGKDHRATVAPTDDTTRAIILPLRSMFLDQVPETREATWY